MPVPGGQQSEKSEFERHSKKETAENYLLGGRGMNYIAIGLSMMMTLLSSISLVQVPGEIFNNGWTLYSLAILNIISVPLWYKLFIPFYFKLRTFTPYSYLELRYDSTVRTTVAVCAFYARIMYLALYDTVTKETVDLLDTETDLDGFFGK